MDERFITVIILLICSYIFEHKILPQLTIWIISILLIYNSVTSGTIVAEDVPYVLLTMMNMVYSTIMIFTDDSMNQGEGR